MGNGEQIGVLRLQSVDRSREASKYLLWSAIVAGAGVNQGTQHRIALCNGRMFREQFAKLQARDGGGDRTKRASVFARSQRLGVVGFEVAGSAVQPNDEQGRSLPLNPFLRLGTQSEQTRERKTCNPRQAAAQEFTPSHGTGAWKR